MVSANPSTRQTVEQRYERYRVSVEQYIRFRRNGFLVVKNLISPEDIAELRAHTEDLMHGRLPEQRAGYVTEHGHKLDAPPADSTPAQRAEFFLRIHMLHRVLQLHERYLLHPRVLDVLECIIGPDVLAMQTMLFIKAPGGVGQGWHQDSYYIPTHPDSLCGAWIAIDDCDEYNGAMWFAQGSNVEPVYPPQEGYGFGDRGLKDIPLVKGISDMDDAKNDLSPVANQYPQVLTPAKAGDVVFFNGHVLHRSKNNTTKDRFRRAFVSHYSNARSFTQWGGEVAFDKTHGAPTVDPITGMTNASHILARGDTHLQFAQPKFGSHCAAVLSPEERKRQSAFAQSNVADMSSGLMEAKPADPNVEHDDGDTAASR